MTDDIASLRASVERLTAEKDKELERSASMASIRSIYCGNPLHGLSDEWKSRAESAEATIARLGRVVRAALAYYATMQVGAGHATGCPLIERNEPCTCGDAEDAALDASFRSLTAEDRRRVGIEG